MMTNTRLHTQWTAVSGCTRVGCSCEQWITHRVHAHAATGEGTVWECACAQLVWREAKERCLSLSLGRGVCIVFNEMSGCRCSLVQRRRGAIRW